MSCLATFDEFGHNNTYRARINSTGSSDEANNICKFLESSLKHLNNNIILNPHKQTQDKLFDTYIEFSEKDWDGYGALPVTERSFYNAKKFLSLLPSEIPEPEIVPEPDGDIALDWHLDNYRNLAVSFDEDDIISYAGFYSKDIKIHGTFPFEDSIPKFLLEIISKVFRA